MWRDLGRKSDIGDGRPVYDAQEAPFRANPAGAPGLDVKLAWKPALTDAPVASGPPQDAFDTVTVVPDCDQTPFQPLLTLPLRLVSMTPPRHRPWLPRPLR
jgi:hypothetical protein